MHAVLKSERGDATPGAWLAVIFVAAITMLSVFTVSDPNQQQVVASGPVGPADPGDDVTLEDNSDQGPQTQVVGGGTRQVGGSEGSTSGGSQGGTTQGGGTAAGQNADCAEGQNAGSSDVGVSAKEIKLGATVVKSGIAKSFLADAQFGIEAVRRKINSQGGVCGRLLTVDYQDDGWDPAAGQQIIQKWIGEGNHFGLVVNPSSEGLRGAINSGLIRENGFPVIGADGQLIGQYKDPWVWPIATSTHSVMHITAKNAYDRGARTFAIVWESNFRFGVEGANAFKKNVERYCGSDCLVAEAKIQANSSYETAANDFVGKCSGDQEFSNCDFVAVLLEPATAAQWVNANGLGTGADGRPGVGIGAPQPLFVNDFVRDNCGLPCAEMEVWTSFNPPIAPFDTDDAVAEYVNDLRAVSSSADASNPHVQGAYVGTRLLVEALEAVGPAPTHENVQQALDQMTFDSKLSKPLKFTPDNHFAAVSAQAFEAVYNIQGSNASFSNWRYTDSGFIDDVDVAKDQLSE